MTVTLNTSSIDVNGVTAVLTDTDTVYSHPSTHPASMLTGALPAISGAALTNLPAASGTLGPVQYSSWSLFLHATKSSGDHTTGALSTITSYGAQGTTQGGSWPTSTGSWNYNAGGTWRTLELNTHGSDSQVTLAHQYYTYQSNSGSDYRIWDHYVRRMYRAVAS